MILLRLLALLPYVALVATLLAAMWWAYRHGYTDGTDDTWELARALVPDLPDTFAQLQAQALDHHAGACTTHELEPSA